MILFEYRYSHPRPSSCLLPATVSSRSNPDVSGRQQAAPYLSSQKYKFPVFISATPIEIQTLWDKLFKIWFASKTFCSKMNFPPAAVHRKCESLGEGTAVTPAVDQTSKSARLPPWLMPPALANAFRHHEGFYAIYTNLRRDSAARLVPLACAEWIAPLQYEKLMVFNHRLSLCRAAICQINTRTRNPAFIFFRHDGK